MYINPLHRLADRQAQFALMQAHPLGAWVLQGQGGLVANHVPFWLDPSRGPCGTLLGHVSRANPVWRELDAPVPCVVMFQGPQAYISPGWYPGRTGHGEVVPTWNYAVVHAHGEAQAMHDRSWLLDVLARLSDAHEATMPKPWTPSEAPAAFMDNMMRAVVGIEIRLQRLEGKLKASQDEALADRWGTVRGLTTQGSDAAQAMALLVRGAIDGGGPDEA